MKNRLTTVTLLLAIMGVPLMAQAQSRVGVININGAIASTEEGKKAIADLQKKYQPRQQEIERLQQEIQAIQDKLAKSTPAVSDDEQRQLTRDLEDKQKVLKRSTDDAQTDFTADRDEAVRRIGQKVVHVITDYSEKNGLTLVIDGAQVPIYYAAKGVDVTPEIVKLYDAANPVGEAGASPKPAAKPATPAPATKPK